MIKRLIVIAFRINRKQSNADKATKMYYFLAVILALACGAALE